MHSQLSHYLRCRLRSLSRHPGFAVVTVLTLAVGIGANTAVFSTLDALVLRELPVQKPEQLVEVSGVYRNASTVPLSYPLFRELSRGQRVFSQLFGWTGSSQSNVELNGKLFLADVRSVTGNYYTGLGVTPLLGRLIALEDPGASDVHVAVIGYEFWERYFARTPDVIGRPIRVGGELFTIIGVTRKWFTGMTPGNPPEVTIPISSSLQPDRLENRSLLWIFATGRLRDGVTPMQAHAQLQSFWPQALAATLPTQDPGQRRQSWLAMRLNVLPAATGISRELREHFTRALCLLMSVVGLILLVACVNLANLTLARAAARTHEFCVRVALGAGRAQVAVQLLAETLLLSLIGALLALGIAWWGSRALVRMMSHGALIAVSFDLRPDWRIFGFTAVAAILTGALIGLAPAWQMSGAEPASILRLHERTVGRGTGTLGKVLIVTQIALSLVLLVGAGLLLRTFENLRLSGHELPETAVLEANLYPRPDGYRNLDMSSYRRQLLEGVSRLPGVTSASFSDTTVPADNSAWQDTVSLSASDTGDLTRLTTIRIVSPGFFPALGDPILSGRAFADSDDEHHPPVAIVDSNLARRLRPTGDIIGQHIRFGVQPEFQQMEIVGVARSASLINLRDPNALVVYVPCAQHPRFSLYGTLLVRTEHPDYLARAVESEVASLGHEYVSETRTIEQANQESLVEERATAMLSSLFAGLALLLAGIGLFGLMSYTVTRRTREIGIRMALGSRRGGIRQLILRETLFLTLLGVVIGLPCALAAARLMSRLLFGVSPSDPLTLSAVPVMLLSVGALAGYLPARRAMNLEPLAALRDE